MEQIKGKFKGLYSKCETSDWYLGHQQIGYCKINQIDEEHVTQFSTGVMIELLCSIENDDVMEFFKQVKDSKFSIIRCRTIKPSAGEYCTVTEVCKGVSFERSEQVIKNGKNSGLMNVMFFADSIEICDFYNYKDYFISKPSELFKEKCFASDRAKELYDKIWEAKLKGYFKENKKPNENSVESGNVKNTVDTPKIEEFHLVKNKDGTFDVSGKVSNVSHHNPNAIYDLTSTELVPKYSINCIRDEETTAITHSLLLQRVVTKDLEDTLFEMTLCE